MAGPGAQVSAPADLCGTRPPSGLNRPQLSRYYLTIHELRAQSTPLEAPREVQQALSIVGLVGPGRQIHRPRALAEALNRPMGVDEYLGMELAAERLQVQQAPPNLRPEAGSVDLGYACPWRRAGLLGHPRRVAFPSPPRGPGPQRHRLLGLEGPNLAGFVGPPTLSLMERPPDEDVHGEPGETQIVVAPAPVLWELSRGEHWYQCTTEEKKSPQLCGFS